MTPTPNANDALMLDLLCAMRPTANRDGLEIWLQDERFDFAYLHTFREDIRRLVVLARTILWQTEPKC